MKKEASSFNSEATLRGLGIEQPQRSTTSFKSFSEERRKAIAEEARLFRGAFDRVLGRMIQPGEGYSEQEIHLAVGDISLSFFAMIDEKVARGVLSKEEATTLAMYVERLVMSTLTGLLSPLNTLAAPGERAN